MPCVCPSETQTLTPSDVTWRVMLAISAGECDVVDTLNTLRLVNAARRIVNKPRPITEVSLRPPVIINAHSPLLPIYCTTSCTIESMTNHTNEFCFTVADVHKGLVQFCHWVHHLQWVSVAVVKTFGDRNLEYFIALLSYEVLYYLISFIFSSLFIHHQ